MTTDEKARQYLTEGRLTVERIGGGWVIASCRGSDQTYRLGFDPRSGHQEWRCTCEANSKFNRRCSHLRALQLVTVRPTEGGSR